MTTPQLLSIRAARSGLSDLVSRAAYRSERTILTRNGKAVAAVVPLSDLEELERKGRAGR